MTTNTDQSAERIAAWQMLGYAAHQLGLGATIAAALPPEKLHTIADGDAYLCGIAGERPACACGCLDVLRRKRALLLLDQIEAEINSRSLDRSTRELLHTVVQGIRHALGAAEAE